MQIFFSLGQTSAMLLHCTDTAPYILAPILFHIICWLLQCRFLVSSRFLQKCFIRHLCKLGCSRLPSLAFRCKLHWHLLKTLACIVIFIDHSEAPYGIYISSPKDKIFV